MRNKRLGGLSVLISMPYIIIGAIIGIIGLPVFLHAEFTDEVRVSYVLPEDRDDGFIGIFMPGEDIPEVIVYNKTLHPVKFLGFLYECNRYGDDPGCSYCEDTYAGVWRIGKFDFQFFRMNFGYPGSDRSNIGIDTFTVGVAVTFKFKYLSFWREIY